jgi:hypothetical protein
LSEIDEFASSLLEESKRFLEKARDQTGDVGRDAMLHASLVLAFSALEAHTNAIADEFSLRQDLTIHEKALLLEQEVRLENGGFVSSGLRMYRLEERILFLHQKFGGRALDRTSPWWSDLASATSLRNQLTHPRARPNISISDVSRAVEAIISALDTLYEAIYQRGFPAVNRGLQSRLGF